MACGCLASCISPTFHPLAPSIPSFLSPPQCHDGHGTITPTCWLFSPRRQTRAQSRFLRGFLSRLQQTAAYKNSRTLVLITTDESRYDNGPNQVGRALRGEGDHVVLAPGFSVSTQLLHALT